MGKLALYGAIGGLGKGLTQMATQEHELEKGEQQTQREIQLQRMRDKAALERQQQADRAAQERQEAEWGPGGYRETYAIGEAGRVADEQRRREQHDIVIENIRQREQNKRAQYRITENMPEFEWEVIPASSVENPYTGQVTHTPESVTIRDHGARYVQTGVSGVGQIWVPEELEAPPVERIREGMAIVNSFLLTARNQEERTQRKHQFLQDFGFLPSIYFDTYAPRNPFRTTERASAEGTTPAVNQ